MRWRILGKPRWPWQALVVTPAERAPLVMLNRYPGQVIGIAFRLPSEPYHGRQVHKQLSITWSRPDVRQYPTDWEDRARRSVLERAKDPVPVMVGAVPDDDVVRTAMSRIAKHDARRLNAVAGAVSAVLDYVPFSRRYAIAVLTLEALLDAHYDATPLCVVCGQPATYRTGAPDPKWCDKHGPLGSMRG